jgi:hypothetical protein
VVKFGFFFQLEVINKKMAQWFAHPQQVCMTYWIHLRFSMYLAKEFLVAAACAVVHAVYPDAFQTHSSDTVRRLVLEMQRAGCRDD